MTEVEVKEARSMLLMDEITENKTEKTAGVLQHAHTSINGNSTDLQ